MLWFRVEDRLPNSKGLYGVSNKLKLNPSDFYISYFDGIGFKCAQESDDELSPYRTPIYWSELKIGKD